jgi:hypothetical protein
VELRTISAVSSVAVPFLVSKAPRAGAILLAAIGGIKAISAFLVSDSRERSASAKKRGFLPDVFSLGVLFKQLFDATGRRPHSDRAAPTSTTCAEAGLNSAGGTPLAGAEGPVVTTSHGALLERIDLLERKLSAAGIPIPNETDWVPLATTAVASGTGSTARTSTGRATYDEKRALLKSNFDLAARKVLCVGGRAALYPEYCRVVEAAGGTLFFYRNNPPMGGEKLSELLAQADMVVCPVDCVNHQAYFTVKRYCKYSGMPFVVLDRSDIRAFRKGVAILAGYTAFRSVGRSYMLSTESPLPVNPVCYQRISAPMNLSYDAHVTLSKGLDIIR